ncbi:single-stranded DNA-binding protein [Candidatus Babeliales bacterium]|nr:single-stranded DNA-binding protein [Candidatus Babeliales bacterium]
MALMLNTVQLAGNLTRDPQVRFFANEKSVADFGLAINRKYRGGDGEMKEETTFIDVEVWNRQAELVGQYLSKGRNCLVEGSLKLEQWEDKEGDKRSKIKISGHRVHFIGGKNDAAQGAAPQDDYKPVSSPQAPSEPISEDPPF